MFKCYQGQIVLKLQTGLTDQPFTFCINLRTKDSESKLDISQRPFQICPEDELRGGEPPSALKGGPGKEAAHLACLGNSEKTKMSHLHHPLLETPGVQASPVPQILLTITHPFHWFWGTLAKAHFTRSGECGT